jgi:uncharacterized protein (TIGR02246 family)
MCSNGKEDRMKLLAYVVMVAALSSAGAAQSTPKAPAKSASVDAAIRAVADLYVKATMAGDAKAIAALYTEDAMEMPPNQPPIKGRAAIQRYYEMALAGAKMANFSLNHLESRAVGDRGYDVGTYRQTITPTGGGGIDDTGKYVVILKRSAGSWKVAYAIYSSDRPMPAGPPR